MYGGDEVSAIVVDLGSHSCKAGYAGEDAPKAVFPSVVGCIGPAGLSDGVKTEGETEELKRSLYVGSQALGYRRDNMEVVPAMKDGVIADWEIADKIWDHAFRERLLIDPKEHPMLLAEPSLNTQQHREKYLSSF
ncbi:hypothetical protein L7F22_004101 [Adiantum nelumboides]|nr:hypothetical protein [Adiantum nelumboides]